MDFDDPIDRHRWLGRLVSEREGLRPKSAQASRANERVHQDPMCSAKGPLRRYGASTSLQGPQPRLAAPSPKTLERPPFLVQIPDRANVKMRRRSRPWTLRADQRRRGVSIP